MTDRNLLNKYVDMMGDNFYLVIAVFIRWKRRCGISMRWSDLSVKQKLNWITIAIRYVGVLG